MRTFAATTHYKSSGHIWQGRFKLFPIQQDEHLLTVLRYVERNPVRAELVERAEQWIWSSAHHWAGSSDRPAFLIPGPVRRPKKWLEWVNQATSPPELGALRRSAIRGTPYGEATWNVKHGQSAGPRIDAETPRPAPKGRGNEASNGMNVPVPFSVPLHISYFRNFLAVQLSYRRSRHFSTTTCRDTKRATSGRPIELLEEP